MKYAFILILFAICGNSIAQPHYNLDITFKEGDVIFYTDNSLIINQAVQGFGYSFVQKINEEKKRGNKFFVSMWLDFNDTTTFRYYTKNGKNYVYQVIDKGFGKNFIFQEDETKRPVFDRLTGKIFFPEGTFLNYKAKYNGYELNGNINSYQANSIYFVIFSSQPEFQKLYKTISI